MKQLKRNNALLILKLVLTITIFSYDSVLYAFDGTGQLNLGNEKNINLLIPLKQGDSYTTFTQGGIDDGTYSLGFGHRVETDNYLFGVNSFYVMDEKDHKRLSIGFEASNKEFNFSANKYFGLDEWAENGGFQTKTADGFDLAFTARPSEIPSLLGHVTYSKFADQKEQFRLGATYQPIPLLGLNLDYDINDEDVIGYIQLTYRFGESLVDQLDANNLPKYQSLQSQRLDLAKIDTQLYQTKKTSIIEQPIIAPQKLIELTVLRDKAPVRENNSLEVKVFKLQNNKMVLIDDVIVKFKTDDLILGVATTQNGLARLDFTSKEPTTFDVFSVSGESISNRVPITFVASNSELSTEPPVNNVTPTEPPVDNVTPTEPPVDNVTPTEPPVDNVTPTEPPVDNETPTEPPVDNVTPTEPPVDNETPTEPPVDNVTPTEPPVDNETPTEPPVDNVTPTEPPVDNVTPTEPPVDNETPTEPPLKNCIDPNSQLNISTTAKGVNSAARGVFNASYGRIEQLEVRGMNIEGGILEVRYYYSSSVITDSRQNINNTIYAFGPIGSPEADIDSSEIYAGINRKQGWNTFTLPPIDSSFAGKSVVLVLRPYNGLYQYMGDVIYNIDILPSGTPICEP